VVNLLRIQVVNYTGFCIQGAKNEYTLILLDGIPLNDPSSISGGAYDLRMISLDQVERIEILKGSQSTLYGTDAIAGVINIITKRGGKKPFEGYGTFSYGSYQTVKASAGLTGALSYFDYTIGYSQNQSQGISESEDRTSSGNFDRDPFKQNAFHTTIGIYPTKAFSISPFIRYTDFKGEYDGGAFTDDTGNKYSGTLMNVGTQAEYSLKKGEIHFQYSFDKTQRVFDDTYGTYRYDGRFQQAEFFFNYMLTRHVQLLSGYSGQYYHMRDTTATEINPTTIIHSPYVSLALGKLNGFAMELGGRYNNHSLYGSNVTYSLNPSYLVRDRIKFFFNFSTGFKAPSLYQLYGEYGANPDLKPEKSRSFEGGIQWFEPNKKMDFRIVGFRRRIEDVIVYTYPVNINSDLQEDYGVEVESSLRPTEKLQLRLFYAYVTGKVTTNTEQENNLLRRPAHSFGIYTGYQITKKFFVSAQLKTFGKRVDKFFNLETFTTDTMKLDAYTLLDVHAEYKAMKQFRFFMDVRNALNEKYSEVAGYATFGTTVQVGLNVNF